MDAITSQTPSNSLRDRMLQDMTMRGFGEHTQKDYIRHVRRFASFLGKPPDLATIEDLRRFQIDQHERAVGPASINGAVSALRFLFGITLKRPEMALGLVVVRFTPKLRVVLSVEESGAAARSGAGHQVQGSAQRGLWRGPARLGGRAPQGRRHRQQRMLIRIEQGKGGRDRNAMLSPHLLDLLRDLVARGQTARRDVAAWLAVPRPPATPIRSQRASCIASCRKPPRCRRSQAGQAAHAAPQLRHPPARGGCRYPRHPGPARPRQLNTTALYTRWRPRR
jgi:integrase/recombinase XerD